MKDDEVEAVGGAGKCKTSDNAFRSLYYIMRRQRTNESMRVCHV